MVQTVDTPEEYAHWLSNASVADEICYHVGPNCKDAKARVAVRESAERGEVFMYLRRVRRHRFAFMARRVRPETGARIKPHPAREYA